MASQPSIAGQAHELTCKVQELERELTEARRQLAATGEILRLISRSPTDVEPVFDAIIASAVKLCGAHQGAVYLYDGNLVHLGAHRNYAPEIIEILGRMYPRPPQLDQVSGRAILNRAVAEIEDMRSDQLYSRELTVVGAWRSQLAVPMFRDEMPIGAIVIARPEAGAFSESHIELLKTFADQAAIAIENARLFEEVQGRTRELTERTRELSETLEYQTATSEVLNVISRSPSDVQPVLDSIAETATGLCKAEYAWILRLEADGLLHLVASMNADSEFIRWLRDQPLKVDAGSGGGRAVLRRATVHIPDVLTDPEYTGSEVLQGQVRWHYRAMLAVPLLKEGAPIGAIVLARNKVLPFSKREIELVSTFADQAVIAINNAGLFAEVQARNRDLTALGDVGRAVSSTLNLKVVLKTAVERAVELSGTDAGSIFYYRPEVGRFELGETAGLDEEAIAKFRRLDIFMGETGMGEAIAKREPLQLPDIAQRPKNPLRDAALETGLRASLIVPLLGGEGALGALVLQRRRTGEFAPSVVSLMQAFADQSAIALENARLFDEIAQKSRELEIASQHKSQFVANMSHELRTPLAAMLGYAELLRDGMFGELPEKSVRIIERVQANGKHLLGLINTVLDISKLESGQFKLTLVEYALDGMVETVRVATESLASAKQLSLRTEVVGGLPYGFGDEPRLTQVLLNLVGNAIKFTDAGEVRITAEAKHGSFVVSVSDTGPGIPDEELQRIFDKFYQVDSTSTKTKGGTGLGLAIAKEIVEMHGGRIWVESILGRGSTFSMELPVRAEVPGAAL